MDLLTLLARYYPFKQSLLETSLPLDQKKKKLVCLSTKKNTSFAIDFQDPLPHREWHQWLFRWF